MARKDRDIPFGEAVRGAYMEKERDRAEEMSYPSPIQPNKSLQQTQDYDLALTTHWKMRVFGFMVSQWQ